jgi:hypothetical protein
MRVFFQISVVFWEMWVLHYPPKKLANIVYFDVGIVVGFQKKKAFFWN